MTERLPEESYDGFSDDVLMLIEEPDGDEIWRNPYVGYYLYDACSDETGWWVKMTCDCTKVGEHKHGGKIYKANEYVTHWMPLPQPPKGGMSMSCEYCHEDRDGYIVPLDKNCHAWLKYPNLLVIKLGKERRECVIRYCPMCGREL